MNDVDEKIPFVPKADLEGINVAEIDHPLKDAAILLLGFFGIVCAGFLLLIIISDWALSKITVQQEMRWLASVWKTEPSFKPIPEELNQLVIKISPHVPFPLQLGLLCSTDINAMTFPGGRILLTQGLLENLRTENGLIFVLGHELGHILHRDHMRGLGRQIILAMGATALGIGDVGSLSALIQTASRVYDRDQEAAADDYGLQLTKKISGHTWGAEELFVLLSEGESVLDRTVSRLVSTHPPSLDRLRKVQKAQHTSPSVVPAQRMIDPQIKDTLAKQCLSN